MKTPRIPTRRDARVVRKTLRGPSYSGNIFLGIVVGLGLELFNILSGGLTLVLPTPAGGFRLHHLWVGLGLMSLGFYMRSLFFIGLGAVLMGGDFYEHLRPDGSLAPFW